MGWCCGPAFPGTAVVDCETQGRLLVPLRDSILREAQPSCGSAEAPDCVSSFVCCCIFFGGGSPICPAVWPWMSVLPWFCLWHLPHLPISPWHLVLWPRAEGGPEGSGETQRFMRGRKVECSGPRNFLEEEIWAVQGWLLLPG